ncbi:MAG: ABC transporter ATP-binding protein/permease [Clostridiales bacterium]|nr:ABC transporter ATP-binding protein/permease [Clostridiales bacterium]
MLQLQNITKNYPVAGGEIEVLKGLNLSFRKNEFVSILGPSGCGKTTTLNIIGGLDKYTSGDLIINGKSTKNFNDRDWDNYRNHRIGFVFQTYNLIPHQTVLGNVELALTISGVSKEERVKRCLNALERVGLKGEENKRPNQLSGGQCQRVAIARALVNEPDILLADEPTGALDSKTSVQIMELIKEISKDKLVIMVTHNGEIAEQYSTRIVRLVDGEIVEDTNPYSSQDEINDTQLELQKERERQEKDALKSPKKKKQKMAKMSRWTAFKLSLQNLFTKRGRTVLTSFAGSIGIIGIALILAVSQGTTGYINHVQQTTLSSYPIVLEEQSIDLTEMMKSFMGMGKNKTEHPNDAVYKAPIIYEMVNALSKVETSKNDLKAFKDYLDSEIVKQESMLGEAITGVQYGYDLDFEVYTKNAKNEIVKSDTKELLEEMFMKFMAGSSTTTGSGSQIMGSGGTMFTTMMTSSGMWQELLPTKDGGMVNDIIKEQYDLVHGDWPTSYDEVVIVLNKNSEIDDLTLYALGLIEREEIDKILDAAIKGEELTVTEKKWSYEDVCKQEYRVLLPYDKYSYSELTDTYNDRSEILGVQGLHDLGLPLKVKGIIRQNKDAENHMLTGNICYTYKLTEHIIENAKNSEVVKAQLASVNTDVLTGLPFKSSTGNLTNEQKKTDFTAYVNGLSVDKKAEIYIDINGIMPEEELNASAIETLQTRYPTIDDQKELIANSLSTQLGMSKEDILKGLEGTSDEQITEAAMTICKTIVEMTYKMQVKNALTSQFNNEQLAGMLDLAMSTYTLDQFATYYDKLLEFSESTYENNLKLLGCLDLTSPYTINIYASSFENKDVIVEAIDSYNNTVEEIAKIKYTDYMGIMMSSISTIIDAITYVLIAFVAISLVVSSIMIGVITLISVQERTKEIGILRSIGASKKDVSSMFNAETIIIGLTSGLLGVLVTYLLCIPINLILQLLTGIATLRAVLPVGAAVILVVISMLLTLFAGIIPSRSAAKKDPVIALRTE